MVPEQSAEYEAVYPLGPVSLTLYVPPPSVTLVPDSEPWNEAGLGPLPVTLIVKFEAVAVPPLSLTTCFFTTRVAGSWLLVNVQVQFSPSSMLMVTVVPLGLALPPFGEVTLQLMESSAHPEGIGPSVIVYPPAGKTVILLKTLVFALVPSATSEKFARGDGLALKGNEVEPCGFACFRIVIEPGKMTASADKDRSWLPPFPSRSINRVWYGEPGIETAELLRPQSLLVAICPPQANTAVEFAVKVMVMRVELSPA